MAGSPAARLHPPLAAFFRVIATNTVGGQVRKPVLRLFFIVVNGYIVTIFNSKIYVRGARVVTRTLSRPRVRKTPRWPRSWASFSLALGRCTPTGMHWPTCIGWANLTPFSLTGVRVADGGAAAALLRT
jgi:hypothetical protein